MNQPTPTKPTGPHETAADIEQAAADWVARVDRGPLSKDDREALEQWAAADPRRSGAYARALAVNLHLDRVAALGDNFAVRPTPVSSPTRRKVLAVAAGAVFASATGIGIIAFEDREAPSEVAILSTAKGAVKEVALQEGSHITLNTLTRIRPEMTGSERKIDLVEGEALFDVSKDPNRPFVVYVGELSVKAVGTSFTVRRTGPDAIKLVVREGIVEVSRNDEVLGLVHAGISFAVDTNSTPVITTLNSTQVDSALAWQGGRLDLQGLTLQEATQEFSRYSDVKIVLDDPSIGRLHITGIYATNDPEGFAENVALSLGLKSVRRGNVVTLSRS